MSKNYTVVGSNLFVSDPEIDRGITSPRLVGKYKSHNDAVVGLRNKEEAEDKTEGSQQFRADIGRPEVESTINGE